MSNTQEPNYWLVGATWGDINKASKFVEHSMWMLACNESDGGTRFERACEEAITIAEQKIKELEQT